MASLHGLNPRADLLRREQALAANVNAASGLKDVLATNLGPKGTLKMLVGGAGQIKTTKDGNVLLKEMHIQHPSAALIARAATAQDAVTGDGSTSSVILVGEIMKLAEREISEGVHPRKLTEGLDAASEAALKFVDRLKIATPGVRKDRELMESVARCSLGTKLDRKMTEQLAGILVDAMQCIMGANPEDMEKEAKDEGKIMLDLNMVEVLSMKQGLCSETQFVRGMVMDHGFRHPDMPTALSNCYVLTCNVSLEYEKTEVNSSFFYNSAEQRARLADAERKFTDMKVQKIIELKREVCTAENKYNFAIFNQKGIDPASLDMLAREGIVALRRVKRRNMERLTLCCGGTPLNSVEEMQASDLGFATRVWETAVGDEKYTFVDGVKDPRSCAVLIRAPSDHAIEQIKDAVRDGLRAIRNAINDAAVLPGAGAFQIACHHYLTSSFFPNVTGKAQLGVAVFASALLGLVKCLVRNAGLDSQDSLLAMQQKYRELNANLTDDQKPIPVGIDLETGDAVDPTGQGVYDSVSVVKQMIVLTTTLASQLILIDEVIKAGKQMGRG